MTMKAKQMCCEMIHNDYGVSFHACTRTATVQRDGKWYCKQHDPESRKVKEAARQAKWDAESRKQDEIERRLAAESKACAGISTEALEAGVVKELVDAANKLVLWRDMPDWMTAQRPMWDAMDSILSAHAKLQQHYSDLPGDAVRDEARADEARDFEEKYGTGERN